MKSGWLAIVLILAIVVLAAVIRCTISTGDTLWLDELHTAWAVGDGLSQVAGRAIDGNQNPLFFWLTWISIQLFGPHEFALRLVSVLAGTGLVAVAGWFTWRGSQSAIGVVVTGLIVAMDWRFIFYGTEARSYALMQLLAACQAFLLAKLMGWLRTNNDQKQNESWLWPAFVAISIALFYCHSMSVLLLVAEGFMVGLFWLVWDKKTLSEKYQFKPLLLAFAAVLVGCLPGILQSRQVFGRRGNWSGVSSIAQLTNDLWQPLSFWIAIPIVCWIVGLLGSKFWQSKLRQSTKVAEDNLHALMTFVLSWALIPIVGVAVAHWTNVAPLALMRYTTVGTVAMPIFAGLVIGMLKPLPIRLIAAIGILFASHQANFVTQELATWGSLPHLRYELWSDPISTINGNVAKRNQPVLLFANVIEDGDAIANLDPRFQEYLLFPVSGFAKVERTGRVVQACPTLPKSDPRRILASQVEEIKEQGGAWVLIRGRAETIEDIERDLRLALQDSSQNITFIHYPMCQSMPYLFSLDIE